MTVYPPKNLLAHKTLTGGSGVVVMKSLAETGVAITSGTLASAERCIQC